MATTTTNFGWDIPQSTDLVKDGATAIAALGQDIDTAFIDLKGGTTGQVLAKASGTDLDFSWVAQDDSNAIQNAIVDAKGDLIAASAADTPARLAVGANGTVLTADSTAATGIKWATPAATTFVGCSVTRTAAQSIANSTYTAIAFTSEDYDTDAIHDNATNNTRLTVPTGKSGKWILSGPVTFASNASGFRIVRIYKNGTGLISLTSAPPASGDNTTGVVSNVFNLTAGDYLEVFVFQNSGASLNVQFADTSVQFTYLGA